jgi:hypothetical protein
MHTETSTHTYILLEKYIRPVSVEKEREREHALLLHGADA